jgi:hypothetical protein
MELLLLLDLIDPQVRPAETLKTSVQLPSVDREPGTAP